MKRSMMLLVIAGMSTLAFTGRKEALLPQGEKESGTETYRNVKHTSFKAGEELRYRIHYGVVDAGEAILKLSTSDKKVNGRTLLHVEGTGRSLGAFDWFFKVRDKYESYIDEKGVFPWLFVRRVYEGGYEINQDYTFMQHKKTVDNGAGKKYTVPENVQDMISAFYYARTLNFDNAKKGDIFTITTFCDDTLFNLKIKFLAKETISLRKGKFKCLKFVPVVQTGRIFKNEEDLSVWITDDKNKIPILAKAKIWVGSIKMEVVEYKNLANPISKVTRKNN
ncbi:MAG: DUF3108 domain-containing protein [Flavobacteriales bacterium]